MYIHVFMYIALIFLQYYRNPSFKVYVSVTLLLNIHTYVCVFIVSMDLQKVYTPICRYIVGIRTYVPTVGMCTHL